VRRRLVRRRRKPGPPTIVARDIPAGDHSSLGRLQAAWDLGAARALDHGKFALALQLQPELRVVADRPAKAQRAGAAVIERPSFRMSAMRPDGMPTSCTRRFGSSGPVGIG
jgi:hypothetical protein